MLLESFYSDLPKIIIASEDILTPGDQPRVLIAMNPAALKANIADLEPGGTAIINIDTFTAGNLKKAGYDSNPLKDGSLAGYRIFEVPIITLNRNALAKIEGMTQRQIDRSGNMFALGLAFWLFDRPLKPTKEFIAKKFVKKTKVIEANHIALQAGYNYGNITRRFQVRYRIKPAALKPGTYRRVTGNQAIALGLVTAAKKAGKPLFYGTYPITPASDILHHLATMKNFDVRTFQAEDEIAAIGSVIGAAYGGAIAATGSSGPGIALKTEAINLAVMAELPMVIINVQRSGPSTGMPTKTEQADLLQVMFGRNSESPVPVLAASTPGNCFYIALEAVRLAVRASVPVFVLSDSYLANSASPWLIPNPDDIPNIEVSHPTKLNSDDEFLPFKRDTETMAPLWAIPGTPGLEHRVGGLAKEPETGDVSYLPEHNQQLMEERLEKVEKLADVIPEVPIFGQTKGDMLVISWGSTFGAVRTAVERLEKSNMVASHVHLHHLNPFPPNLGNILNQFKRILVPELNMGQLSLLLKRRFPEHTYLKLNKMQGRPLMIKDVLDKLKELLGGVK
ncbi:MAG: hypothetical protein B6242_13375 [Anaerolineaceae bacterium 4572_78]|nr:MAG: hypothetical protein B6242_13375 [Anaerolineaceae bacterium 4572_78]